MSKSFSVLSAEFLHETNTFSRIPTDFARFEAQDCYLDHASALAARGDSNAELAGFLDAARAHGWQIHHVLSAIAQPAGRVTRDAFDRITGAIVAAARERAGTLDGVILGLHGAMVTEDHDDGEGELLRRLRAVLGPAVPIAVTLDLHANVTRAMCEHANIIVSYQTYPHVDMRRTGRQAGDILQRTMAGEIRPVTLRAHLPMIDEANGGRTDQGAMLPRLARARALEATESDVFAVSINAGFSRADIAEIGPTVLVVAQGDLARHQSFAEDLADDIWARRHEVVNRFLDVQEAAAVCAAHPVDGRPIIVAEYSDNPGGGAYGDATALLGALLEAGVGRACFGPIVDPETVQALQALPLGSMVDVQLGGKTDPRVGGGPLALRVSLEHKSDGHYFATGPMTGGQHRSWGPTVVVRIRDMDILVVTQPAQMLDLAQFTGFGIDPASMRVVGLKSMQHFRAAFEPIASRVIICDSGALCTPDPTRLPYTRLPRPLHPFDQDIDLAQWRADLSASDLASDAVAIPADPTDALAHPEEAVAAPTPATNPPPAPAAAPRPRIDREAATALLERLAGWYPQLFGATFRPLKRGIFEDLMQARGADIDEATLKAALTLHTRSTRYLAAVANGERRRDLGGRAVEDMAPEHVFQAIAEVHRRRQAKTDEDLEPRLRQRLARAFEASGLSREAYAAFAHSRDPVIQGAIDTVLAEVGGRNARDEALLRAFQASKQPIESFADAYGLDPESARQSIERARRQLAA
jgi:microcystin degradation protein MlrC/sRNA-binding protein